MSSLDAPALLGFAVGIAGTVAAFAAKYAFDFRLGKRRIELDERAALATTLGGRPGQLRRASSRMKDRVDGIFRDAAQLPTWLKPGPTNTADGYFLRSSVQRLFLFVSWAALMQQALDALPEETLRARQDLQRQYALLDLGVEVLTNISMFPGYPNYPTDRDGYHLFTGTVDQLADLGVATYNSSSLVIPTSAFVEAYDEGDPALMRLRAWLGDVGTPKPGAVVIKARLACLGAILTELLESTGTPDFTKHPTLKHRLAGLPGAEGYDFVALLPSWLDAGFAGATRRWQRPR